MYELEAWEQEAIENQMDELAGVAMANGFDEAEAYLMAEATFNSIPDHLKSFRAYLNYHCGVEGDELEEMVAATP